MSVRAKFLCTVVKHNSWQKGHRNTENVELTAVASNDPNDPNHAWSEATPDGKVTLVITNKAAHGLFAAGKEYYLDFSEVSEPTVSA